MSDDSASEESDVEESTQIKDAVPIEDADLSKLDQIDNPIDLPEFDIINGIKIYTGTTIRSRQTYERSIEYLKSLLPPGEKLFSELYPSTLTAQGLMSNISFDEQSIIDMLPVPTGDIMLIGCNYGELINPDYKIPVVVKKTGRGRKPKPKSKTKRRSQGSGKYFSSQITFIIQHPESKIKYKIKLFRNGVFQVPGVKDPSMADLVVPIGILRDYLAKCFAEDVQVLNFRAVMRNYKAKLLNDKIRVDLEDLERKINKYKSYSRFLPFINYFLRGVPDELFGRMAQFVDKSNPLNIAEITYNTDRCFCLILKFYRPMPADNMKKTTVKLLKKGKINFDGGNSEYETIELYHWLEYLYYQNAASILVEVSKIRNEYDPEAFANISEPISECYYCDSCGYHEDKHDFSVPPDYTANCRFMEGASRDGVEGCGNTTDDIDLHYKTIECTCKSCPKKIAINAAAKKKKTKAGKVDDEIADKMFK